MPIYFNLANGIDIDKVLISLDMELKTNLCGHIHNKNLNLYIDSFDEGLGIEDKRDTLL